VDWALGPYVLALAMGGLAGNVRSKRASAQARRASGRTHESVSDELRLLLNDGVTRAVNYGSLLAVIAILALMVVKP